MKKSRIILFVALVLAVLAIFAACAKKDDGSSSSTKKSTAKHDHSYTWEVTREATCSQTGSRVGTCSCGDEKKEPIESLPHTFGENNTEPATCTAFGRVYHVCSVCEEVEEIEQLPLIAHNYTKTADISGKYTLYECSECQTSYVRTTETANDLFYWTCSETPFDSSLATFNPDFELAENGFDDYIMANGNKVAAMGRYKDDQCCMLSLKDSKAQLLNQNFVLQMDFMYTQMPAPNSQTLLCLDTAGGAGPTLIIGKDGSIYYVSNQVYKNKVSSETNALLSDVTLEVNTWYNLAVVYHGAETYNDGSNIRVPYDVYLNGVCIIDYETLKDATNSKGEAIAPATTYFKTDKNPEFRISDAGTGQGGNTHKMAFDNLRIYLGKTVDTNYVKAGPYTFGTKTVIIDYPATIDQAAWEEMNGRISTKKDAE